MFPHHQTIPNKQAGADPTKTVLSNTEFPPAIHQPSSQEAPFLFQIHWMFPPDLELLISALISHTTINFIQFKSILKVNSFIEI